MRLMERSSRTPLDVGAYLRRIHHEPPRAPTADALASLHRAHLFAIPFENLDIHPRVDALKRGFGIVE